MTTPGAEAARNSADLAGSRALVLGLGRFGGGLGAARWLLGEGARVTVTDRLPQSELAEPAAELASAGATLALGGHDGLDVSDYDLLVVNPAVPLGAPLVVAARRAGLTVTSEMALLLSRWPGPVLGVTGSNGKSTTVSMAAALLQAAGVSARAGGNLGGSLLGELEGANEQTVAVVELSSFMLEVTGPLGLGPEVAVVTNITPNHLDRHGTFQEYREAKGAALVAARCAVLPSYEPVARELPRPPGCERLVFGPAGEGVDLGVDEAGALVDASGTRRLAADGLAFPGQVARLDLAAATLAVASLLGDRDRAFAALPAAAAAWRAPPHRLATVLSAEGVVWIDDSVSTTPESTAASLAAVGAPCVLICGGHDKGLDPTALIEAAGTHVRLALTVGEQADRLVQALSAAGIAALNAETVEQAVMLAASRVEKGDTVLLSPGYSSHDQFVHFEARGEAFARSVAELHANTD